MRRQITSKVHNLDTNFLRKNQTTILKKLCLRNQDKEGDIKDVLEDNQVVHFSTVLA